MHTENALLMRSDPATIYELAADVPRWPEMLPHYRWVRVLEAGNDRRIVEMAARRDFIPVRWIAEQRLFPTEPRIEFRHIGGVTTGMEVEWLFTPLSEGTLVRIKHDLTLGWPVIGGFAAHRVIGPYFIEAIAGKTLRTIRQLAEQRSPTHAGGSR